MRTLMTLSCMFHFMPTVLTIILLPLLQWNTASATLGLGCIMISFSVTMNKLNSSSLAKVSVNSITVGSVDVSPAGEARDLGMWLDSNLTMSTHINKTCGAAFFYLYNIRLNIKFVSKESTETLICAFITSWLDYCNSFFYVLPNSLMLKLQRIQNACTRLVY